MDDLEKIARSRELPEQIAPIGQQMLLNLALGGDVEIWIKAPGAEPTDYVAVILSRKEKINEQFDQTMVDLGFPEGTGRMI